MKKIKPQMVVIKKTDNNKYWQWMWKGKPSHISGRNKCEMIYIYITALENNLVVSKSWT